MIMYFSYVLCWLCEKNKDDWDDKLGLEIPSVLNHNENDREFY